MNTETQLKMAEDLANTIDLHLGVKPDTEKCAIERLLAQTEGLLSEVIRLKTLTDKQLANRPLTAEEKAWIQTAWEEYRAAEKPAGKDTSLFAKMHGRDA
jgi:hypothetical protein